VEFLPSTHSSTATSTRVSPESSPSASTSSHNRNHYAPAGEAGQSEQDAVPTVYGSASSQHGASSYDSDNESAASVSRSADEDYTARHVSDTDEDDEFNDTDEHNMTDFDEDGLDEYGDEDSLTDDDYQSRGSAEYDDSHDDYEHSSVVQETYTDSDNESHDSRRQAESDVQRRTLGDWLHTPSVSEDEHVEENDSENRASRTGSSHRLRAELEPGDDAEEDEQLENAATREQDTGLSDQQERMTVRLRLNSHQSGDDVQLSPAANDTENEHISHVSPNLSDVDSADDNYDEDGGVHRYDISQERSISDTDISDLDYNPSPSRYRNSSSSSSLVPASPSPSLQYNDDHVDDDESFSPSSLQSHLHDDDDEDDANSTHHNSDDSLTEEDTQTASQRYNLRSSTDNSLVRKSRPVSPALSTGSSSPTREASKQSSGRHSWTASRSHNSCTSIDSDHDTDESGSLTDVCGVKRRRSASSATDDDEDDVADMPDSGRGHRLHKLRRFR